MSSSSTVFTHRHCQAVTLPAEARFPEHVKRVDVRVVGVERIISPAGCAWDSFFNAEPPAGDGFPSQRASQTQSARESLDVRDGPAAAA